MAMRRNMDLVRALLLYVVDKIDDPLHIDRGGNMKKYVTRGDFYEGFGDRVGVELVDMHVKLLASEGFFILDPKETYIKVIGLSWKGHDLIEGY